MVKKFPPGCIRVTRVGVRHIPDHMPGDIGSSRPECKQMEEHYGKSRIPRGWRYVCRKLFRRKICGKMSSRKRLIRPRADHLIVGELLPVHHVSSRGLHAGDQEVGTATGAGNRIGSHRSHARGFGKSHPDKIAGRTRAALNSATRGCAVGCTADPPDCVTHGFNTYCTDTAGIRRKDCVKCRGLRL